MKADLGIMLHQRLTAIGHPYREKCRMTVESTKSGHIAILHAREVETDRAHTPGTLHALSQSVDRIIYAAGLA